MATKSLKLRICIASALLCTCYVNGVAENTNINDMSNMEGQRVETNPHIEHSWMDTTDIGIGFSQGQESHSYFSDYSTVTPVTHIPNGHVYRNEQSKGHNSKSPEIFAETLQPLTKYDENSKSIVFVQGKIAANGGTKYTLHRYRAHAAGGGSAFNTDDTYTEDNLGTTASIGVGYRLLSPSEHSYVGVNAFYDRAFKNSHSRISGGVEYVVGQNTVYANIYRSISGQKKSGTISYGIIKNS